ncbi:NUDIX hydrolase [Flavobacterium caeni]|uniref:NUDIX domain-containing protein n=1 Tax=Flavobacterium caeni TaxID=490189 RepID=A0A1G5JGD2_9FLAO|nr:CoA pyrophosphatase [Flavobacterium caeni]SCY87347.1 NUDIX domain-containing protein [Flavobacterium caeni]
MNFSDFLTLIPKIENAWLPGEEAHAMMSPPERRAIMQNLDLKAKNPKQAAVMMLFYPRNEKTHLVLIIRNAYPGVHSSQIAFPGGKIEQEDASIKETALRETEEEIGITASQITVVRQFSQVYIPPSNFLVYPFFGYATQELIFNPDPSEVAGMIEMPLEHFLDDDNVEMMQMATSYSASIGVPVFKFNQHRVWGATAMMMSELKEVLKSVL